MSINESKLLSLTCRYHNDQVAAGKNPDVEDSRSHVLENLKQLAPEEVTRARVRIAERLQQRKREAQRVRKANLKRWWLALRHLENLISAVDIQNEDLTDSAFREVVGRRDPRDRILDVPDTIGGPALKCLLLLSLHARACSIGAEILSFLEIGHVEGAMGRTRTLYEIAVVASIISNDGIEGTYELSERYYVTSILEEVSYDYAVQRITNTNQREGSAEARLEDTKKLLIRAAKRTWGSRFKKQYDWARPAVPNQQKIRQIKFTHLEHASEAEWMRHSYLEMNHAIHAGPSTTISRTKFRGRKLNITGPAVEPWETSRAGHAATFLLMMICNIIGFGVCRETECWDDDLIIAAINEHAHAAIIAFRQGK
jgi:hypothetical protein